VPSQDDYRPNVAAAPQPAPAPARPAPAAAPQPATERPAPPITLEQRGPKVLVSALGAGSPGEKAGIRAGDVLLSVDGETVFSAAQARGMLRDPPNTMASVRVSRDGRVLSLRLRRAGI
jgi:S1-C subfamily serine protease